MSASTDAGELIRALRARPGRGGVRLSYAQAQLALQLIEAGALALKRDLRVRRGVTPGRGKAAALADAGLVPRR